MPLQNNRIKCLIIAIATFVYACTNGVQPHNNTQTEADILTLQTQVQQLQTRFDSVIQVLQPKTAPSSKKIKAKAKAATQAAALYSTGKASEYNWQPDDSKATPTVKPKREEALYRVRTGAICRDGTRSYATGRGACSHHGGVSEWLYE